MKTLAGVILVFVMAWPAHGGGFTSVEIDGTQYTNIEKAYVGAGGRIIIINSAGGTSARADQVPADFLASWNIKLEVAKTAEKQRTAEQLERAIALGSFRQIDAIVYDTRKPNPGWVTFPSAKVIQILDNGAILDISPGADASFVIHVKHLPRSLGDTDTIRFSAKLVGDYSYIAPLDIFYLIRKALPRQFQFSFKD
jgi:hypothetical protein